MNRTALSFCFPLIRSELEKNARAYFVVSFFEMRYVSILSATHFVPNRPPVKCHCGISQELEAIHSAEMDCRYAFVWIFGNKGRCLLFSFFTIF